ncbi:DUF2804 domain-containing protein [Streptomyces sp. NBC_01754]|uniref:DUF2804 domain-containing protein n=1 Tax=Streptomyces sp. NBC_01754 TaxID=2975930 RepID=UPI002DDA2E53|nr:DUF2804 domain-containing protein [Streptomyces sp. NBC_01754]WSC93197.1 DUF2804 domain-containing protein [Streptomyces sp. NBC_01754]
MATHEHEITGPVDLCLPDGTLNPAAVGWSRTPLHRANLRGWGRTKRWEYWCVTTPTHLVALTVSDLDFLALNTVYLLEYGPAGREFECTSIIPGGYGVRLPDTVAGTPGAPDLVVGPARPSGGKVRIEICDEPSGTRLRARCLTPDRLPFEVDLLVARPEGHESLSVVVPWSGRRFQYTSKHTALPAAGQVRIGTEITEFGGDEAAWAVLDHGRGRWPRTVDWNWGAASGRTDGHTVGLQFGGRWTVGTGSTENGLCVDGRLTKIGEELDWRWSASDPLAPWTIRTPSSDQVDLTFTPFHNRSAHTDAGLIANRTDQCFGHYDGHVRTDDGTEMAVEHLLGWAEDVHMRW